MSPTLPEKLKYQHTGANRKSMARKKKVDAQADHAELLCQIARLFCEREWCLATSGNFSVRAQEGHCLISQSGKDKMKLTPDDLMICDLEGKPVDAELQPSAETALHACLYTLDEEIGAVLHTHSVTAAVLSRAADADLYFEHYEMQKAFSGINSHIGGAGLVIFENSQDMSSITDELEGRWDSGDITAPGFLIRGHGLYAWGKDPQEAQRHAEGLEFLMSCAWQEKIAKR